MANIGEKKAKLAKTKRETLKTATSYWQFLETQKLKL